MKVITMTYRVEFPDDLPDGDCYSCAVEIMSQDRAWPYDHQIQLTHEPGEPKDE